MVESLNAPACITGRRWDVLAWNTAADDLFGFSLMAAADRNTLISMLTTQAARKRFGAGWADEARRMIALVRLTHDLFAEYRAFRARIRAGCPAFAGWWKSHDIRGPIAGRKRLNFRQEGGGVRLCRLPGQRRPGFYDCHLRFCDRRGLANGHFRRTMLSKDGVGG